MKRPEFDLTLDGDGLNLDVIDILDLANFLVEVRKAVCSAAGIEAEGRGDRPALLNLVGVAPGSACLRLRSGDIVHQGAVRIATALANHDPDQLPRESRESLSNVSNWLVRRNWTLRWDDGEGHTAIISRDNPVAVPLRRQMRGKTTIYGVLKRIGGDKATAWILLPASGRQQVVKMSQELAKELGPRLYEFIGLEGDAVWRPLDWSIDEFTATRLLGYRVADPVEAFQELAEAAASRWDGIDADSYVKGLRSEDDEG